MKKLIYIFAMVIILATLSSAELIVPTNDNTASKYPVIEPNKDLLSAIYLTNISMNNSYIPYSGAWQDVNLNNRNLMNVNIFEVHNITGHSPIYISDNVLLGKYNISADFFIGNGSRLTDLNFSGIPYTGATQNVTLGTWNMSIGERLKITGSNPSIQFGDGGNLYFKDTGGQTFHFSNGIYIDGGTNDFLNTEYGYFDWLKVSNFINVSHNISIGEKLCNMTSGVCYTLEELNDTSGLASNYVPYTGATANLSMGIFNVSAKQFIINDYLNLTYNTTHTIFNTGNKPWCIGACI